MKSINDNFFNEINVNAIVPPKNPLVIEIEKMNIMIQHMKT
jgi:hypothetical protein